MEMAKRPPEPARHHAPAKTDLDKSTLTSMRLPKWTLKDLRERAKKAHISQSDIIRRALALWRALDDQPPGTCLAFVDPDDDNRIVGFPVIQP